MTEEKNEESLTLDKKTMDVLVAHIIPTSKYFEARFDHMQDQIDGLKVDLKEFRGDVDRRFEQVDKRFDAMKSDSDKRFEQVDKCFEQVDKRFEQVDKRFEQVDKRFEQMIASIDRLGDKLEHRDENQRAFTLRMFTVAIKYLYSRCAGRFFESTGCFLTDRAKSNLLVR